MSLIKARWIQIFFLNLCVNFTFAQIYPEPNSKLNYTSVYFAEDFVAKAERYELSLALNSGDLSAGKSVRTATAVIPAFWLHELSWGQNYFWQVKSYSGKKLISTSSVHSFTIGDIIYRSFDEVRMKILTNKKEKHAGGLICVDYAKSIYNRKGERVWTIPDITGIVDLTTNIRDIKVTRDNTVTFLTIPIPVEIDFDGNVLWKAPNPFVFLNDTIMYHHDFKKTSRNTYMVLGDKKVWRKMPYYDSTASIENEVETKVVNNQLYKKVMIAILLEFDRNGKLIWYWDANDYIAEVDLGHNKNKAGKPMPMTHANAFGENKEGTKVYVGFRDLSRIVKIDKKTKKVEQSYGEKFPSGEARVGHNLFKHQHDANVTEHNSIYILNNNGALSPEGISSIMELRDNVVNPDSVLIWKFDLDFDTLSKGKSLNGGNVNELPNKNLLLCGGALNRIFEVTKKREIVWDAFLHARGKKDTLWQEMSQYRCSWTAQLNRYYFKAQLRKTELKNQAPLTLEIYNTGNAGDNYRIDFISSQGDVLKTVETGEVKAMESVLRIITLKEIENCETFIVRSDRSNKIWDVNIR